MADATQQGAAGPDPEELAGASILRLTPFVEQMGTPAAIRKEFWWEREWRLVGNLWFRPRDIVVVFVPQGEHQAFQEQLQAAGLYHTNMPAFVDAQWRLERMMGELTNVQDIGPFPD